MVVIWFIAIWMIGCEDTAHGIGGDTILGLSIILLTKRNVIDLLPIP